MKSEYDPILDAALDEVLGGQTPPDLTLRILQALEQRAHHEGNGSSTLKHALPIVPPPLEDDVVPPPVTVGPMPAVRIAAAKRSGFHSSFAAFTAAGLAAVLLLAASIGVYL